MDSKLNGSFWSYKKKNGEKSPHTLSVIEDIQETNEKKVGTDFQTAFLRKYYVFVAFQRIPIHPTHQKRPSVGGLGRGKKNILRSRRPKRFACAQTLVISGPTLIPRLGGLSLPSPAFRSTPHRSQGDRNPSDLEGKEKRIKYNNNKTTTHTHKRIIKQPDRNYY